MAPIGAVALAPAGSIYSADVCTLVIYFRASAALPLVVAANRDEFLSRPTADPRMITDEPWVVAGQDLRAGGTWFGVNEHRMVAGVLNRWRHQGPHPDRRSRGLLCLEVLQTRSPQEALERLQAVRGSDYNAFNLLVANGDEAYVASNSHDEVRITALAAGVHLLTNLELNDPTCPRIAKSHRAFEDLKLPETAEALPKLVGSLRGILSDHSMALDPRGDPVDNTLCVHHRGYGTRSSAIITCGSPGATVRYWYAAGPPCRKAFREIAIPA